jgi:predicted XRE-type DNA-binding protein
MKAKEIKKETKSKKIISNVFEDLGFENPEEDLAKSNLIIEISRIIREKKLTQAQVAKILGITQPRVSSLLSGNLDLFSIDMIMNLLKILGQDIEISIKPKPKNRKHAQLSVISSSEKVSLTMVANSRMMTS